MAAQILPHDVTEHLEAAIQLSNRRVHLRFLDEAELLIAFNFPAAAVLVASVALESIPRGIAEPVVSEVQQQIDNWFGLRASVVHTHIPTVTLDQAKDMIEGVRKLLTQDMKVGKRDDLGKTQAESPGRIRGKYKFVPTSSAEFIRRKVDELRLEHE